ncbi:hypothetical protein WNB94_04840 [Aquabacterium sp. A3]|uniref:hypothetical protein n=1 Tax=Aquabacterium sp. A3 TaxID=3132829 RepID=UPI003119860A
MGFLLQVASSAASRLVYMYLLGLITQLEPTFAVPHAALLANANGLCALFTLNVFQHYLANSNAAEHDAVRPVRAQFELLSLLLLLSTALMLIGSGHAAFSTWSTVLVGALALALPEVVFTMATARNLAWRALILYGGHTVFFGGYILAVIQQQAPVTAVLYAAGPTFATCLALVTLALPANSPSRWRDRQQALLGTLRLRIHLLASSLPVIAMPPALVFLMQVTPGMAEQIPQMLLFISFAGALVFLMGNVFQHYGRDLLPKLLVIHAQGQLWRLAALIGVVIVFCTGLVWPIDMAMHMFKNGFQAPFDGPWVAYAVVLATSTIVLQWHTVISLHHGQPRSVLKSNLVYLGLGCLLVLTTPWHGMSILSILAASAAARASLNLIDFTSASKR